MADSSLDRLQITDAGLERTLGCVYHRGRSLSRAAEAFIAALVDSADPDLVAAA